MRFLVIDRGGTISLEPSEAEAIFLATRNWVKEKMEMGKIELAYAMSGQMSSVMIFKADTHEELDDMMLDYPLSNYSVFEIYPLSDVLHSLEKAGQTFREKRQMAA